jgi:hypothetical protein
MRQQRSRFLFKALFVFISILVGLFLGEIALRIAGYSFPEFYQVDLARGFSLRPGIEGWYSKEGKAYVQINSDGLRDTEHATAKPPGTLRIAILGDSYPEALQVARESAFWAILEKQLTACYPNRRIEVINFGVSGYGTAQELITLRQHVWKYSPDIVVLAFTTSNDITDNSQVLRHTNEVPYFVHENGQLRLDDSFLTSSGFRFRQSSQGSTGRWFRDHSRVLQATLDAARTIRLWITSLRSLTPEEKSSSDPAKVRNGNLAVSAELGLDNLVYTEPQNDEWKEAWSVTEDLVRTMRDEVNAKGAKFLVVTLSNGPQVIPSADTRKAFMRTFGITDLFYPDHRIKRLGDREGFKVINLAPEMQDYAVKNNVMLHGFDKNLGSGHWNENGHRLAADLLTQKLCALGWVK